MAEKEPLEEALQNPQQVSSDGQSVRTHSLRDMIEADKYLEQKKARGKMGMRISQLVPPGGRGV